jgi:hypothetical protein
LNRLVLLLPLLGACAGPAGNTPQAQCAREAYNDPDVKRMIMEQAGSPYLMRTDQAELEQAKHQAALRCLRARGLAPPGGVEPLRQPEEHTLF